MLETISTAQQTGYLTNNRVDLSGSIYGLIRNQGGEFSALNPEYPNVQIATGMLESAYPSTDFAHIIIQADTSTPPQLVGRDGIVDYLVSGSGVYVLKRPGEEVEVIPWNTTHSIVDRRQRGEDKQYTSPGIAPQYPSISYPAGSFIAFFAGAHGAQLFETCTPPYNEGEPNLEEKYADIDFPEDFVSVCKTIAGTHKVHRESRLISHARRVKPTTK